MHSHLSFGTNGYVRDSPRVPDPALVLAQEANQPRSGSLRETLWRSRARSLLSSTLGLRRGGARYMMDLARHGLHACSLATREGLSDGSDRGPALVGVQSTSMLPRTAFGKGRAWDSLRTDRRQLRIFHAATCPWLRVAMGLGFTLLFTRRSC